MWFSAVTAMTLAGYSWFTFSITAWRTEFRKKMNEAENQGSATVVDSLLNFETVKYFDRAAAPQPTDPMAWPGPAYSQVFRQGYRARAIGPSLLPSISTPVAATSAARMLSCTHMLYTYPCSILFPQCYVLYHVCCIHTTMYRT